MYRKMCIMNAEYYIATFFLHVMTAAAKHVLLRLPLLRYRNIVNS